jgi:Thrombospondin type 3 repeat
MPANGAWALRVGGWAARVGVLGLLVVFAASLDAWSTADAHPGHPQKKLFGGHWYHADIPANIDLTTANFFYGDPNYGNCDGGVNTASCISKWSGPFLEAINDWNAQPMDVTFIRTGNQSGSNDIFVIVSDLVLDDPQILGIGLLYDFNGTWCGSLPGGYDSCTYYYGDAWQADDGHSGPYGTQPSKRATVLHEIGHLINLRHESVNANESVQYECGFDNTGPTPVSIMSYDCIDPLAVGGSGYSTVQDWDTCGVNHKYFDPAIGFAECHVNDTDGDGHEDTLDNCPSASNPTQSNVDPDGFGDACDPDIDADGIVNASDPERDGDKVLNVDETPCGSDPNDGSRRPERVDGMFFEVTDDGDIPVDEALPAGAANFDCDGDGYKGSAEASIFSGGGNGDRDPCGNNGWPSDLSTQAPANQLNLSDLASFVSPIRRLGTTPANAEYSARWDIVPGSTIGAYINVQDIAALLLGPSGYPPMLPGVRAYGQTCFWPQ